MDWLTVFHPVVPRAQRPRFLTRTADQAILLYTGAVRLIDRAENPTSIRGDVRLEWLPSPRVTLRSAEVSPCLLPTLLDDMNGGPLAPTRPHLSVRVPAAPVEIPAFVSHLGKGLTLRLLAPVEVGMQEGFASVVFHVPNFPDYHGGAISSRGGRRRWAGRVTLEFDGWRVTLDEINHHSHLERRLSRAAGVGITHIGTLERADGSLFGSHATKHVLERLSFLLSFVRGAWTCCTLPVACGNDGGERWAEWGAPRVARTNGLSWLSEIHPESMALLAPGFFTRIEAWHWWEAITFALNCYYESNAADGMLQTATVLEQTALETLAWTYFVEDGRLTEEAFTARARWGASDRIRMLLCEAHVPMGIPAQLASLSTLAQREGWQDGPRALTALRNAIAHPNRRKALGDLFEPSLADCWRLGVWYLEMVLLWLFAYDGVYASRLNPNPVPGHVERVPWAPSPLP